MSRNSNTMQVFEHQTLKVGQEKFELRHFKALEKYGYSTKEKLFSVGNQRIKFKQYVGVIQVKDLTIEVLPKIDGALRNDDESSKDIWHDALIEMLQVCRLLNIHSLSNAKLKLRSSSILDLYYDLFLFQCETIVKQGLVKRYRTTNVNSRKVKGKILFDENIKKNAFHKERIFVQHTIFDRDNKYNQILLKALVILQKVNHDPAHSIRIKRLLLDLETVTEKSIVESWFQNLSFGRNTERYKEPISLAKLIILNFSPDLKGGNESVISIMFDMNLLFEKYVFRKLKTIELDPNFPITKVKEQNRIPFWQSRGLRADIIIEAQDKKIVVDTKWKVLKKSTPSDEDLKQMFVYNLHYETKLSILLYPKTDLETMDKKAFTKYDQQNCQLAFVNIFDGRGKLEKELGKKIYNELLKQEIIEAN